MAQMKPTKKSESDFHDAVPVKDGSENGRQLDEVRLNERQNKSVGRDDNNNSGKTRNDVHSRELSEAEKVSLNEQPFMSRSEPSNEYDEFVEPETSTCGYFDKENENSFGDKYRLIGLGPGTMTKAYPAGTEIVGIRCGICFRKNPKPKLIGNHKNVVVYETAEQN